MNVVIRAAAQRAAVAERVATERAQPQPWMLQCYPPLHERGSVDDLSDVGRLAYLMFAKHAADVTALAEELFREGRRTAEETLLQEAHAVGCPVLSVHLSTGALLSWLRERADWAAQKIFCLIAECVYAPAPEQTAEIRRLADRYKLYVPYL